MNYSRFAQATLLVATMLAGWSCSKSRPAQSAGEQSRVEAEFSRCLAQEQYGDATSCWQAFLAHHGESASAAENAYAREKIARSSPVPTFIHPGMPDEAAGMFRSPERETFRAPDALGEIPQPTVPQLQDNGEFPKASIGFEDCYRGFRLSGNVDRDLGELAKRCGRPCGMIPYSAVVSGEQAEQDRVNIYAVNLTKDRCYRFFAVGQKGVSDLDSALADEKGNILVRDVFNDAAPIIGPKEPYCPEQSGQYKYVVSVARGGGTFKFQIWQGPKDGM